MTAPIWSGIALREAFHLHLLRVLAQRRGTAGWALKGGVNLRLYFGSVRYSEDIDLDAEPRLHQALKRDLLAILKDAAFRRRLAQLGIRELRPAQPKLAKDTPTTGRIKLLLGTGAVDYATKIDLSFRPRDEREVVELAPPDEAIARRYLTLPGEYPFLVPHYPRTPAVRQKLSALAGRKSVQARDVFDLRVLAGDGREAEIDKPLVRAQLSDAVLQEAITRAYHLPEDAFRDKVLAFLDEEHRAAWAPQWTELQLFVVELAQELQALAGGPAALEPVVTTGEEDDEDE